MTNLLIIIASVRPGRVGLPVGQWVTERALAADGLEVRVADLAEIALPFMDEPQHPVARNYQHEHTIRWSEQVEWADAFIFVCPEYNHSFAPSLKNAIDYLNHEWRNKALGFVSYGGLSGGTRAVTALEPVTSSLGLLKSKHSVEINFVGKRVEDGVFESDEHIEKALALLLAELRDLGDALRPLR